MESDGQRSEAKSDSITAECWTKYIYTFGTAWIFRQRARKYRRRLQILNFLGIAVPLTVGATLLAFGLERPLLNTILFIAAGFFGIAQVLLSLWSLAAKWDDLHAYATESASDNSRLANRYRMLASNPPTDLEELKTRFGHLETENETRDALDQKQAPNHDEMNAGHRAGLRQLSKECDGCGVAPMSMEPSECNVCGNFRKRRIYL